MAPRGMREDGQFGFGSPEVTVNWRETAARWATPSRHSDRFVTLPNCGAEGEGKVLISSGMVAGNQAPCPNKYSQSSHRHRHKVDEQIEITERDMRTLSTLGLNCCRK